MAPPQEPPPARFIAWHVRVRDARGRVHRSRYFKERWFWFGKSSIVVQRECQERLAFFIFHNLLAWAAILVPVLAIVAIPALAQRITTYPIVLVVLFTLVINLAMRMGGLRSGAERVLAKWTTQMRPDDPCLACGYPLVSVVPADDGCVECPECAAAWRIQASAAATSDSVPARAGASEASRAPAS